MSMRMEIDIVGTRVDGVDIGQAETLLELVCEPMLARLLLLISKSIQM